MLRVILFGCPRVSTDIDGVDLKLTRVIQSLLAYLVLQRQRSHAREVLAGVFWSENRQDRARACLNTALWRLRNALEAYASPGDPFLIVSQQGDVQFNAGSSYWLDVEIFEGLLDHLPARSSQTLEEVQIQLAEQAVALYRGDLMEGYYDDWVLSERERLRNRYLYGLAFLMSAYRLKGDLEASLGCGKKILQQEPLREEVHRGMMRLYLQAGQRALAIRQYELCRTTLQTELGITPMPETENLYWQILNQLSSDPLPTAPDFPVQPVAKSHSRFDGGSTAEQVFSLIQMIASGEIAVSLDMVAPLRQALEQLEQAQQLSSAAMVQFRQVVDTILYLSNHNKSF